MSQGDDTGVQLVGTLVALAVAVLLAAVGACDVDHDTAVRVLEDDGYEDVRIGDHAWFACGDTFASEWTAERNGRRVEGSVCCGVFKDCTVRH
jgi:hypothetical protein